MFPGKTVAGGPILRTIPCSWSVPSSIGTGVRPRSATCWIPFESARIWAGFWRLFVQLK
jgi:hypothetical protein